jgi:hypothetical protein
MAYCEIYRRYHVFLARIGLGKSRISLEKFSVIADLGISFSDCLLSANL